jgi:hypothetical protein
MKARTCRTSGRSEALASPPLCRWGAESDPVLADIGLHLCTAGQNGVFSGKKLPFGEFFLEQNAPITF